MVVLRHACSGNLINNVKRYTIEGKVIEQVTKMNILSVPWTDNMQVDRTTIKMKLNLAAKRLHNIRTAIIVHIAKEWHVLIDSIFKSQLAKNYWPLLMHDRGSRTLLDKQAPKYLKVIFNWSRNIPDKLVRLVTRFEKTTTTLRHIATLGLASEHKATFEAMVRLLEESENNSIKSIAKMKRQQQHRILIPDHSILSLREQLDRNRRYANPVHCLKISNTLNNYDTANISAQIDSLDQIGELGNQGPIWHLVEQNKATMAIEMLSSDKLQALAAKHTSYAISYFNTLSLMLKITTNRGIMNRKLILKSTSSILQALNNLRNNDWRVIQLREAISNNGWKVYKAEANFYKLFSKHLIESINEQELDPALVYTNPIDFQPRYQHTTNQTNQTKSDQPTKTNYPKDQ